MVDHGEDVGMMATLNSWLHKSRGNHQQPTINVSYSITREPIPRGLLCLVMCLAFAIEGLFFIGQVMYPDLHTDPLAT
jgi:hypothetical protein